jgi:RNA polymerase sigma factor (sigma-70 family)
MAGAYHWPSPTPAMNDRPDSSLRSSDSKLQLTSSLTLLGLARAGDRVALDRLIARYLPRLQRWASGRLPRWARDLAETQDLVQEALVQTFRNIEGFEARGDWALQAYLRQAILNRIRDELRKAKRRPAQVDLDPERPDDGRSPLEDAIGTETVERYEGALARLDAESREAIIAKIELGFSNQEIAELLGKPTANAARMAVQRAILRLAAEMGGADP